MADDDKFDQALRDARASWQDGLGLRGNQSPRTVDNMEAAHEPFSMKVTESRVSTRDIQSPLRMSLDPIYDTPSAGGDKVFDIYGMQDGHPVVFHVVCVGDPTPVPEV